MREMGKYNFKNNVVYITDEKYVMPTCVSIVSLNMHMQKPEELCVYILCDEICTESRNKLEALKSN